MGEFDLNRAAPPEYVERQFDSVVCLNVLEHIEDDLGVFARAEMAPFTGQQSLDADLTGTGLVGPVAAVIDHIPFAVVLVHRCVDALLRLGCRRNQVNPEAGIHGRGLQMCRR